MSDKNVVANFGRVYDRIMSLRNDDDYVVNPVQMSKFLDLVNFFFRKKIEDDDIEVNPYEFKPREQHGGVTATFIVFDLSGNAEVTDFCEVLKSCSAVTIDVVDREKVSISCTVPDVFVHK